MPVITKDALSGKHGAYRMALTNSPCGTKSRASSRSSSNADGRHRREESERLTAYAHDELVERDKANLDLFWIKDDSLEDSANLPAPDMLAAEIMEDLEAALAPFSLIAGDLAAHRNEGSPTSERPDCVLSGNGFGNPLGLGARKLAGESGRWATVP